MAADRDFINDFREVFPELDGSVTEARLHQAHRVASEIVTGTSEQFLWAVAHLTQALLTDLSGDTMSVSIGGVRRSYKTISKTANDVFWSTTHYGRVYLTLIRQTPATGLALAAMI